ncbi:MAG: hypothetical protein HGA87_00745 [Desulfobulbaceae bacterium]|nr:hypothetical protein [Desulfobulbaceae bacterium]
MGIPVLGDIINTVGGLIDDLHTSGEEKMKATLDARDQDIKELGIYADLVKGQTSVNLAEAQHKSIFVAGWRPFIGWVGGIALSYQFILYPLLSWIWMAAKPGFQHPAPLESDLLWTLVAGMLGIGTMRTAEKVKGVSTDSLVKFKLK